MKQLIKRLFRKDLVRPMPPAVDHQRATLDAVLAALAKAGFTEPQRLIQTTPAPLTPPEPAHPGVDWPNWIEVMETFATPGWAPGRFAGRAAGNGLVFYYGIGKGDYAVFLTPFVVCEHPIAEEGLFHPEVTSGQVNLANLLHLPSGMALGVFNDRATACEAAGIIGAMVPRLSEIDWGRYREPIHAAFRFHGICESEERHAHIHPGGPGFGIWAKAAANLTAGKPERLS